MICSRTVSPQLAWAMRPPDAINGGGGWRKRDKSDGLGSLLCGRN
jgi:hypothetical protein